MSSPRSRRLLFLDGYTVATDGDPTAGALASSDSIGYGITASDALKAGLAAAGWEVVQPAKAVTGGGGPVQRLRWLLSAYDGVLDVLSGPEPPDAVFVFHAFSVFPAEIRRMLLDLELDIPLLGYTHGSHWDPTDTYRLEAYPGMELVDLANLCALDRVFLVSNYLRDTLATTVAELNPSVADALSARCVVVGLPLDTARLDASRTDERDPRTTVIFNHAPVASKDPALFARVMRRLLPCHDLRVVFSREFGPTDAGGLDVAALAADFPDRVVLGHDLPLADYYRALWMADLQVSTATHESLGVSTLEAMYAGTCCLLPDLGSYPEITQGNRDALYDRTEDQLEQRLAYFLAHPDRRRAVAADLQRAAARYRPAAIVPGIAAVLDELCARAPGDRS